MITVSLTDLKPFEQCFYSSGGMVGWRLLMWHRGQNWELVGLRCEFSRIQFDPTARHLRSVSPFVCRVVRDRDETRRLGTSHSVECGTLVSVEWRRFGLRSQTRNQYLLRVSYVTTARVQAIPRSPIVVSYKALALHKVDQRVFLVAPVSTG